MKGITKNDLLDWKNHPVTKAYQAGLESKIREIEMSLGTGISLNYDNPYATASLTAKFTGEIQGLKEALDIDTEFVTIEE